MNRFRRWLSRLMFKLAPGLNDLVRSAGGTIERLREEVTLLRLANNERDAHNRGILAEYKEALAMASGGPWAAVGTDASGVRESAVPVRESDVPALKQFRERLWDLELALEDQGWARQVAYSQMEFSRWGTQQIMLLCRLYRIKNPLIQRGILVSSYYIFGRGFEVSSPDKTCQEVLDKFFNDPRNQKELGLKALTDKEAAMYTDGNIFWCLFTDPVTGETLVRTIDPIEIVEIVADANDGSVTQFYKRQWTAEEFDIKTGQRKYVPRTQWYVDVDYEPDTRVTTIGDIPVAMDETETDYIRILHQKDGGLAKWHFGCPRAYAALDWARAYKQRLEDYASITRALARFAWDVKTKGGAPAIAALKGTLATTLVNDGSMIEQNPPAVTGSSFISGPGNTITPVKTAGVTPSPDEGRRLAHMVYMVFGLGEHFFADIATGNLATATSLDRPTELKFQHDQEIWDETITRFCKFALQRSRKAPKGLLREATNAAKGNPKKAKVTEDNIVRVEFPPIREGDIPMLSNALVSAMTLNNKGGQVTGIDERAGVLALMKLNGVPDADELIELMYPIDEYEPNRAEQLLSQPIPMATPSPGGEPQIGPDGKPIKPTLKKAGKAQEAAMLRLAESIDNWIRATGGKHGNAGS